MKSLLCFFTLCLLAVISHAQPIIEWQKSYGGTGYETWRSIQQTNDGGYILAGDTDSKDGDIAGNHGSTDAWVMKLSKFGNVEWTKTLGGTGVEFGAYIQQTSDGGYILANATTSNNGDVSGNHGGFDYWIVKLSPTGVITWKKTLGGSGYDSVRSIHQTSDGGYIVAGATDSNNGDVSNNHGSRDFWVVKLSDTGSLQWQKTLGGTLEDIANAIQQTSDGGYIVSGVVQSNDGDVSGNHGSLDCWVVKLTQSGDIQWQKTYGGSDNEFSYSIVQTNDGGYVVAGHSNSTNGQVFGNHGLSDFWVLKLSALGGIQWQKSIGGSDAEEAYSIRQTMDGGYVVAGFTNSTDGDVSGAHGMGDGWLVKLSNTGAIQWQKPLGGSNVDGLYAIQQTTEGSYIAVGTGWSTDGDATENQGFSDLWVVSLSPVVGVEDVFTRPEPLEIAPNPSDGICYLKTASNDPTLAVTVSDFSGRQVNQQTIQNGQGMDLTTLPNGLYFFTATAPSGRTFFNKMSLQK